MTKKQTYIEVNGKRYDALTGKRIQSADGTPLQSSQKTAPKPSLDGVVHRKKPQTETKHTVHSLVQNESHKTLKKTQNSKTLMRQLVKKPHTLKDKERSTNTQNTHQQTHTQAQQITPTPKKVSAPAGAHLKPNSHQPNQAIQHSVIPNKSTTAIDAHTQQSESDNAIDRALADAKSHLALPLQKKRKSFKQRFGVNGKIASIGAALVAVLLFGSFFAYQNVPNLAMRVASTRAGFQATMPAYRPAGFTFAGPIEYRSGEIIVNFKSRTADNRSYTVTQRASNWNNEALLANFVISNDKQYQTYQERNKIIYLYNNSHATWLNNGVWYQIEGEAQLTSDQIIRIANSL